MLRVFPLKDLLPYSKKVVKIAAIPAKSIRLTNSLMKANQQPEIRKKIHEENAHVGAMLTQTEIREAMIAIFQKRKPNFKQFN